MRNPLYLKLCALALAAFLGAGCSGDTPPSDVAEPRPGSAAEEEPIPTPEAKIPSRPDRLARVINRNEKHLVDALKKWRRNGARLSDKKVPEIKLRVLYQQRITRRLADRPRLYTRVRPRLSVLAKRFYSANVSAAHRLAALGGGEPPEEPPDFRYERPEPPNDLWRYYSIAKAEFGVPRSILASVNFVETKFGRVLGPSSAGARGPMQFIPSTWDAYGDGGDTWDPRDSIIGAARYLSASGAPERMRDALFAYNRSSAYVDVILIHARQMREHPIRYLNYYWWQVFVWTQDGPTQMTGPGSPRPGL